MSGQLYVIATPIGNLNDLTPRALETMKMVDILACEDTRHTEKLLRHFGFFKELWRYDEHTHLKASQKIQGALKSGRNVGLVSDAGTPGISDPGTRLVEDVIKAGYQVIPIAGPSAVSVAVSACGLPGDGYVFLGFLPRKKGPMGRMLQEALGLGRKIVFFESPFRILETLHWLSEICPEHPIVVARELTKMHEEFIRGTAANIAQELEKNPRKGEFVVVIGRL